MGYQDELQCPEPQASSFQEMASFVLALIAATLKAGSGWQDFQNKDVEVGIYFGFGITCSGHGHLLSSASFLMCTVVALFLSL